MLAEGVDVYRVVSPSWQIKTARNVFASTIERGKALGWKPKVSERAWRPRGVRLPGGIEKGIFGKVTEDPPCVKNLLEGVSEGRRDWAAFLLGNYLASWRGIDRTTVVEMLVEWNRRNRPPLPVSEILAKSGRLGAYTLGCKAFSPWCDTARCRRKLDKLLGASRSGHAPDR